MSIATEITRLQGAKSSLKTSIEEKGVTVPSATKIDGYAALVDQIQGGDTDGLNGFLSVESKTIPTSASATTNITYNKNCGILDENYKKWDTLVWHQRWVDNGYSATGLSKPIGIWMKAFGLDLVFLWHLVDSKTTYEVTGTTSIPSYNFGLYMCSNAALISERSGNSYPATVSGAIGHGTAGKYNAKEWTATISGDGLDMYSSNTKETFHIPSRNVGEANIFRMDNSEDYMESYYQQCLFYRACFAICSGIACPTGTTNGTATTVEILNASGQQAAVGEDMYFWIDGNNTGLKAKYNLNSQLVTNYTTGQGTSYNLTQVIADAIYAKQVAAGINMNDTGVNSASKPILKDGCLGATAVAVDGYWYIKTPYISQPNQTSTSPSVNMQDAPAVFACKAKNVTMMSDRQLFPYYLNYTTHITSIVDLLRTKENLSVDVPALLNAGKWTAIRYSNTSPIQITIKGAIQATDFSPTGMLIIPCPLSTQQYT